MNEIKITGAEFESIEHYVDRQNDLTREIFACKHAAEHVKAVNHAGKPVLIGGELISVFDDTMPMLMAFLAATKLELERQARTMELTLRIGTEEEVEDIEDEPYL